MGGRVSTHFPLFNSFKYSRRFSRYIWHIWIAVVVLYRLERVNFSYQDSMTCSVHSASFISLISIDKENKTKLKPPLPSPPVSPLPLPSASFTPCSAPAHVPAYASKPGPVSVSAFASVPARAKGRARASVSFKHMQHYSDLSDSINAGQVTPITNSELIVW